MFRKFAAIAALAFCTAASFAAQTSVDTSGLSEAQVAELKAHAAKIVADAAKKADPTGVIADAANNSSTVMTLAATWGQQAATAAEGFAKAMGIAAKELNVTVNDFLNSPAGKLTAALIIWKVAGAALIKILYAMVFVSVGLIMARVIYKRLFIKEYKEVQYERFFGAFKGTKLVPVPKGINELENDGEWLVFWVMMATTMGSLLIGGLII